MAEVVVADNTIGEGVILAQRLEQLARPGTVCIQGSVYEAVPRRFPFDYHSLGDQDLKGFVEPIRAFDAKRRKGEQLPQPEAGAPTHPPPVRRWPRIVIARALGCVAVMAGAVAWLAQRDDSTTVAPAPQAAMALPDKPSIAVLPFSNLGNDPAQAYFVDGMTVDLITDLSKVSGLFVIARSSVFAYQGKT